MDDPVLTIIVLMSILFGSLVPSIIALARGKGWVKSAGCAALAFAGWLYFPIVLVCLIAIVALWWSCKSEQHLKCPSDNANIR